jgi:hypothetical protein
MPPNFYYDQEDFLRERQQGKAWHWTALRPEATTGFGLGNPMNLGMSIAVYAAISKELGLPLRFPGTEKSYGILYQITSAEILAKATTWAGQSEAAKNEIFNITNGDYFRWKYLWPRIAAMFDMPAADPIPTPLTVYMADKKPVWETIVRKHGLQPLPYEQVSSWPFADAVLRLMEYDNITSTIKARHAGFHDCIDTEEMFSKFFQKSSTDAGDLLKKQSSCASPLMCFASLLGKRCTASKKILTKLFTVAAGSEFFFPMTYNSNWRLDSCKT